MSGTLAGYLQVSIAGQSPAAVSTLSGVALASSVSLSCLDKTTGAAPCNGTIALKPGSSLTFGTSAGVALGSTYSLTFTLVNNTAATIPRPTIVNSTVYSTPVFTSPDLASVPGSIASQTSASFTLVFTPQASAAGPSTPQTATLNVGSASFTLQGYELITNNNDPMQVTCVYSTGTPCQAPANAAGTYSVGPLPNTLAVVFQVTNPNPIGTVDADIQLSAPPSISDATDFSMGTQTLALTGSSSGATAVSAGQPITIHPGYSLMFKVTFTGLNPANGTLTIGNGVSYVLAGQPAPVVGTSQSDLPGITLMCGTAPCSSATFSSQQQVQATLQVSTATTAGANLAISFKPLVSGITDPAVTFIKPFTQTNLNFLFTPASMSGMLSNNQPQFTFQTGTSAGTISFTLTDSATLQTIALPSITIQSSLVQITSSTAVRQSPNLVVTIAGYDNSYSVGALSFNFYDLNGKLLTPNPIQVNATSAFQQYFFSAANTTGGAFSLQVTFPVQGDVNQIGSVTTSLTNSAGQASVTTAFPPPPTS